MKLKDFRKQQVYTLIPKMLVDLILFPLKDWVADVYKIWQNNELDK